MRLILHRALKSPEATLGTLSVSTGNKEQFICYTLEDCYREIDGEPVANWKIKGLTAIPRGEYEIKYTESARFGKKTLQLMDVPGFTGIRIHAGNTAKDTDGCILPGLTQHTDSISGSYSVVNSRAAVNKIEDLVLPVLRSGEKVTIKIC